MRLKDETKIKKLIKMFGNQIIRKRVERKKHRERKTVFSFILFFLSRCLSIQQKGCRNQNEPQRAT